VLIDSLLFLHIQHQSTTITFHFFKLSKVENFPKVVVHTKNATLEGALIFQILFQGKGKLTRMDKHDNKTSLQKIPSWRGSNKFYYHLLALLFENTTTQRRKRPVPPPNHALVL
jgi:hypothetical protein